MIKCNFLQSFSQIRQSSPFFQCYHQRHSKSFQQRNNLPPARITLTCTGFLHTELLEFFQDKINLHLTVYHHRAEAKAKAKLLRFRSNWSISDQESDITFTFTWREYSCTNQYSPSKAMSLSLLLSLNRSLSLNLHRGVF